MLLSVTTIQIKISLIEKLKTTFLSTVLRNVITCRFKCEQFVNFKRLFQERKTVIQWLLISDIMLFVLRTV